MTLSTATLEALDRRGAWVVRRAAARALRPDPDLKVSEWAARYRVIASEEGAESGRWSNDRAPYLTEIMDCLSPSHPAATVTVMKCAQTGLSQVATNFLFYVADQAPGPSMMIQSTVPAAQGWVREKLMPALGATRRLRGRIAEQRSRSEEGSTTLYKRFPGGFWLMTGANSAADLRQRTIRFMVKDDWDEWPEDVDGQGDPDGMADARLINFRNHGTSKCLQGSTPTIEGRSRSAKAYEASDQRVFEVPCPHCGALQELVWENLKFSLVPPHHAHYACAECGALIEHHHKQAMLAAGSWRATAPGFGRDPGFRITGVMSAFIHWDHLAADFAKAKDDPQKLKVFYNTKIGRPWKEAGTAPPWQDLLKRVEPWKLRTVPAGVLVVTSGVDVQKDELRYEVVGWGPGKTSWSIDFGALPGDTADTGPNGPWAQLEALRARRFPDAFGRARGIDMMAIDAGYNTQAVYDFVRRRPGVMAVKGVPGPQAVILAPAKKEETTQRGKLKRRGVQLWRVGAWRLKSELYGNLRKQPPQVNGEPVENAAPPLGYCHFTQSHDQAFFTELTNEHLITHLKGGKRVMEWVEKGPNHQLDARVYAMAAAEHVGVSRMTIGDWQALADRLEVPSAATEADLFSLALARGARPRSDNGPIAGLYPPTQNAAVPPDPHGAPQPRRDADAPADAMPPDSVPGVQEATQDAASHRAVELPSRLDALDLPATERRRPARKRITVRPKERW